MSGGKREVDDGMLTSKDSAYHLLTFFILGMSWSPRGSSSRSLTRWASLMGSSSGVISSSSSSVDVGAGIPLLLLHAPLAPPSLTCEEL